MLNFKRYVKSFTSEHKTLPSHHPYSPNVDIAHTSQSSPLMSGETLDNEKLLEEENSDCENHIPTSPRKTILARAITWAAIGLCLFCVFVLGRTTANTPNHVNDFNSREPVSLGKCPPDWEEAKEAGCVYDVILSTWMHPRCFNSELYERYIDILISMNLTYWWEPEMHNEVPFDVVVRGEHGWVWTRGTFHYLHCSYVVDRILEASKRQPRVLDTLCRDEKHIGHCVSYNGDPDWRDVIAPNATRIFNEPYLVDCLVG